VARIAIGDIQGCHSELRALLKKLRFRPDRDRLWLVGDLVNRGPASLAVLRFMHALRDNAITVLGNHDLHLLAVAYGTDRRLRPDDTLRRVLAARDRDRLLDWLITLPLAHLDAGHNDLMVHAGLPPQWSAADTVRHAATTSAALQKNPGRFLARMYGNQPDRWSASLRGADRHRFVVNVLTRLRYCDARGRINLDLKDNPGSLRAAARAAPTAMRPWFLAPNRRSAGTRVICGHWSTLGLVQKPDLLALDTGCVWGGALSAVDLDSGRLWQQRRLGPGRHITNS
jgi:bis(5'-nucleosyl)-tetraphosphatase (symmetrical)